jgi:hypothetical protein
MSGSDGTSSPVHHWSAPLESIKLAKGKGKKKKNVQRIEWLKLYGRMRTTMTNERREKNTKQRNPKRMDTEREKRERKGTRNGLERESKGRCWIGPMDYYDTGSTLQQTHPFIIIIMK